MLAEMWSKFSISTKVLIAIVLAWVLLLISGTIDSLFLLKNYLKLEQQLANDDVVRVQSAIDKIEISLQTQAANWAVWDDGYKFVIDKNQPFINTNLTPTAVAPTAADMMVILNRDNNVVYQIALNDERTEAVPLPNLLLNSFKPSTKLGKHLYQPGDNVNGFGLLYSENGLLFLGYRSIVKSDGTGPANGTWIFVKKLNNKVKETLESTTKLKLDIIPIATLPNKDEDPVLQQLLKSHTHFATITLKDAYGYLLLNDINDEPVAILKVAIPRTVFLSGFETILYFNIILIISGIIFSLLVYYLLHNLIIKRLNNLNKTFTEVGATKDYSTSVSVKGTDELASLGNETNQLFSTIRNYQTDNKKMLDKISDELNQSNILSQKLKLAEEFLIDVFNSIPSMLTIINHEKTILEINSRTENKIHQPSDKVKGLSLFEIFPFLKKYEPNINEAIRSGEITMIEKISIIADKKQRYLNIVIFPLTKLNIFTVRIDDVTKLMRLQEKMRQSDKLASIGVLTAGIMHEINNPVNFILSAISPLKKDLTDLASLIKHIDETQSVASVQKYAADSDMNYTLEEVSSLVTGIKDGINRTSKITGGLQSASHEDKSEIVLTDIHECIDSTLTLLSHRLKGKIEVIKEYADLPLVNCQSGRLNQAIMNIVSNAIDAIMNTGRIIIKTKQADDNHIKISIADTGIGIKPESIEKIFDPFFTTKEVGKGTGLGLSITHSIINEMNGRIEINSKLNEGTEFIITLPIHQ